MPTIDKETTRARAKYYFRINVPKILANSHQVPESLINDKLETKSKIAVTFKEQYYRAEFLALREAFACIDDPIVRDVLFEKYVMNATYTQIEATHRISHDTITRYCNQGLMLFAKNLDCVKSLAPTYCWGLPLVAYT